MTTQQRVVFSAIDRDTGETRKLVGDLLYIGQETSVRAFQDVLPSKNSYPSYTVRNASIHSVVILVLHVESGNIYKIYDFENIKIFKGNDKKQKV
jgi:hypothetical protein